MFTPQDWEQFVAHHAPPNLLLVAVDETDGVVGYTAVHPDDGEMYLLFVHPAHAGRGIGRTLLAAAHDALQSAGCGRRSSSCTSRTSGRSPCTRQRPTARTVQMLGLPWKTYPRAAARQAALVGAKSSHQDDNEGESRDGQDRIVACFRKHSRPPHNRGQAKNWVLHRTYASIAPRNVLGDLSLIGREEPCSRGCDARLPLARRDDRRSRPHLAW